MTCVETKELIPLLAGKDLDGDEAAGVREHIAACPACRAEYDGFAACVKALAQASPADVPESVLKGFWDGVEQGIARKDEHAPAFRSFRHIAAAAAVLLLGIGVGFLAFKTFQRKPSDAVKPESGSNPSGTLRCNTCFPASDILTNQARRV
jgi:anti-sigma factor RsiW